ncbi:hypothetical protein VPH35_130982 [Triticum aestivum]
MADARGDADVATGDVVELHSAVAVDKVKDVGGVHSGVGKLATAVDVEKEVAGSASALSEKKVTTSNGAAHPDAQPSEEQEEDDGWEKNRKLDLTGSWTRTIQGIYISGENLDVDNGNFGSFKVKEEEKIRAKGDDYYYKHKTNIWRCPYCTTKPKPKSGGFVHLLAHEDDVAIHYEDYKIKG